MRCQEIFRRDYIDLKIERYPNAFSQCNSLVELPKCSRPHHRARFGLLFADSSETIVTAKTFTLVENAKNIGSRGSSKPIVELCLTFLIALNQPIDQFISQLVI